MPPRLSLFAIAAFMAAAVALSTERMDKLAQVNSVISGEGFAPPGDNLITDCLT